MGRGLLMILGGCSRGGRTRKPEERVERGGPRRSDREDRTEKIGPSKAWRIRKSGAQSAPVQKSPVVFGPVFSVRRFRSVVFGPSFSSRRFRSVVFGPSFYAYLTHLATSRSDGFFPYISIPTR